MNASSHEVVIIMKRDKIKTKKKRVENISSLYLTWSSLVKTVRVCLRTSGERSLTQADILETWRSTSVVYL